MREDVVRHLLKILDCVVNLMNFKVFVVVKAPVDDLIELLAGVFNCCLLWQQLLWILGGGPNSGPVLANPLCHSTNIIKYQLNWSPRRPIQRLQLVRLQF